MTSAFHIGGGWIRRTTRLAVYLRDEFRCVWCDTSLVAVHPRRVTLDHLTSRELGGSNRPENLVTSCLTCNTERGRRTVGAYARTLPDPAAVLARIRRHRRRQIDAARAAAILADPEQDPRPVVRAARRAGRILAPATSAAGLRTGSVKHATAVTSSPPSDDSEEWYGF